MQAPEQLAEGLERVFYFGSKSIGLHKTYHVEEAVFSDRFYLFKIAKLLSVGYKRTAQFLYPEGSKQNLGNLCKTL